MNRRGLVPRKTHVRDARLFVIATEGEKTESDYFSIFESSRIHLEILGTGPDGRSAPKHVLSRLATFAEKYDLDDRDELWLVADIDHQRPEFLKEVVTAARENGFRVALSNPCFELWLLLHFSELAEQYDKCNQVESALRARLGSYNKANLDRSKFSRENVQLAINRARLLVYDETEGWPTTNGTHLYRLVERLLPFSTL